MEQQGRDEVEEVGLWVFAADIGSQLAQLLLAEVPKALPRSVREHGFWLPGLAEDHPTLLADAPTPSQVLVQGRDDLCGQHQDIIPLEHSDP
eukprot:1416786-Lingulodinium_polyedra.AAC.1